MLRFSHWVVAVGQRTISRNLGYLEFLALTFNHFGGDFLDKIRGFIGNGGRQFVTADPFAEPSPERCC